jgi:hypothetical protein
MYLRGGLISTRINEIFSGSTAQEETPETLSTKIQPYIQEYATLYKFTIQQVEVIEKILVSFFTKNVAVKDVYYKHNGNGKEIFNHVFSRFPQGTIEVQLGPTSLSFLCEDPFDYSRIYHGKFGGSIDQSQLERSNRSGGVFMYHAPVKDLMGTLLPLA